MRDGAAFETILDVSFFLAPSCWSIYDYAFINNGRYFSCNWTGTTFEGADLSGANFEDAVIGGCAFRHRDEQTLDERNRWGSNLMSFSCDQVVRMPSVCVQTLRSSESQGFRSDVGTDDSKA